MKIYFKLVFLLLVVFVSSVHGQTINLIRFNNTANYAGGSGVSVIINPTGVFELNNQFILQLSDSVGTWNSPKTLTTLNEFYVPVINGTLPSGLSAGSYKLRVISTLPQDTVETVSFNVVTGSSLEIPNFKSNLNSESNNQFTCLGVCSPASNIFGQLNAPVNKQTSIINEVERTNFLCLYNTSNTYKVTLIDVLTKKITDIPIKTDGSFIVPNNLSIGTYVFEIEANNSGVSTIFSNIFLFHGNFTGLGNLSGETVCIGDTVSWSVDAVGISRNYLGSKYQIDFGDGSPIEYYTQTQLIQIGQISHTFKSVTCSVGTPESSNQGYFITQIKLLNKGIYNSGNNSNYCNNYYENGNGVDKRVNTSKNPIAGFNLQSSQCIQSPIIATNTSILGQYGTSVCLNTPKYYWAYKKPSASDFTTLPDNSTWIVNNDLIIPVSELELGCWEIKLWAQNAGGGCAKTTDKLHYITIEANPLPTFTYTPASPICANTTVQFTNTSSILKSKCQNPAYQWTVTPETVTSDTTSCYQFMPNPPAASDGKNAQINFTKPGTYYVTLTIINACGSSTSAPTKIEVNGDPSINVVSSTTFSDCASNPANYVLDFNTSPQKPAYSTLHYAPKSYEWTVSGTGVTASDYTISDPTLPYPKINFKAFKTYNIKIKITGNCSGSFEKTYTFTLNEIPSITNVNLTQTICSGTSTTVFPLTSSMSGTIFDWTVKQTNISTVVPSSGSGDTIPAIVLNNSANIDGTVTYTITPKNNGCVGISKDYVVTVSPKATVNAILPVTICNNVSYSASPFASNVTGATFKWENDNIAIGLGSGGNGNLPTFNTINSGTTILTANIKVTPIFAGCEGTPLTFKISVNPTPTVDDITSFTKCVGDPSGLISFSGAVTGTVFNWTNTNSSIGIATSGSGNIPSIALKNTTTTIQTATITVTPTYTNGGITCNGASKSFTITVNPVAQVNQATSQVLCNGGSTNKIVFSTNNTSGTTTYKWENNTTSIGLNSIGTGDINSFSAINTGTVPVIATINVTPTYTNNGVNCTGPTMSFTITVNPTAQVIQPVDQIICNATPTTITFNTNNTGGTTTYTWSNSDSSIGLGLSGNGNISFTSINSGTAPKEAIINVTPNYTNAGTSCSGSTKTFKIKVNPIAVVTFSQPNQVKCSGETTNVVTLNSTTVGVSYNWTATQPIGITGTFVSSGTNTIPAQTLENTTDTPIDITYSAIATVTDSAKCQGAISTYIIRINPKPKITTTINSSACSGTGFISTPSSTGGNIIPIGTTYSWGIPTVTGSMTGGTTGSNVTTISGTFTNPTNIAQTATYTLTPRANGCDGPTFNVVVTIYPKPVLSNKSLTVCSGTNFTVNLTDPSDIIPAGTTYTWDIPTVTGSITGGAGGNNASVITGNLTNATNSAQTATYTVTPVSGSTVSCPGNSFTITVTVKPALKATITANTNNACLNSTSPTITLTGSNGTPPYTFTYKLNGGAETTIQTSGASSTASINVPTNTVTTYTYSLVNVLDGSSQACSQTVSGSAIVNIIELSNIVTVQDTSICSGSTFSFKPRSDGGNTIPTGTTYTWKTPVSFPVGAITGGSSQSVAQASISQTLTNNTNTPATLTYTITPYTGICAGSTFKLTVTVNPTPKITNQTIPICSGDVFVISPTNDAINIVPAGTTYTWGTTPVSAPLGAITGGSAQLTGQSSISQTLINTTNTPATLTYTVTPTSGEAGNCDGASFTIIVTVNPKPSITVQPVEICGSGIFTSSPINGGGNIVPTGTTYSWNNPKVTGGMIGGVAGTNQSSISNYLENTTNVVQTAIYTVTPKSGTCIGSPFTLTVTVSPKPVIITHTDVICSGDLFSVLPTNGGGNIIPAGTTYTWDLPVSLPVGAITGGSLQSAAQASISQILTNTTNTPATLTYQVTPNSNGCIGSAFTVIVTVNPTPKITNQTIPICSGNEFVISPTNDANNIVPTGTTYNWSKPVSAPLGAITGGSAQLTGQSSISQTLINTTNASATLTYTVTPTSGAAGKCVGIPFEVVVTVNPTPKITTPQIQTICNKTTFFITPKNEVGNIVPTDTKYTWSAPVISPIATAITGGSLQTTAQDAISQTLTNITDQKATATYIVTPISGSCNGNPFQVVVTVNPSPKVVFSKADQPICSGATSTIVNLSSLTTGTVSFEWTANVPAGVSGATLSGTNVIPAQTLVNTTNEPLTVIYSAKAMLNNSVSCSDNTFDYKITVNPVAMVNPVSNVKLCDNENSSLITFGSNVTGTTFKWVNNKTSIGLAANGNGNLPVFTATNSNIAPVVATITVTPTANGCDGTPRSFTITVNPTPTVDKPTDQTVCNGFKTTDISFSGNIATTTYNWTNDNSTIGLAAIGTGNIPAFTAINNGNAVVIANITVTPIVDGCTGTPKNLTITINPSPAITQQPQSSSVCIDGIPNTLSIAYKNGTGIPKFEWYRNSVRDSLSGTLIPTATSETYVPPTNAIGTMYYYCILTLPSGGCSSLISNIATVTVNPLPSISTQPIPTQKICVGGTINPFIVAYTGGTGTPTYQWYSNNTNSNSGGTAISGATSAIYTLPTFNTVGKYYYYAIVSLNGNGCGNAISEVAEVNVLPDPIVTNQPLNSQTVCQSTVPTDLSLVVTGGEGTFSYQWYSNSSNNIIGGSAINQAKTSVLTPPTDVVGTKYYYCVIGQKGLGCGVTSAVSEVKVNLVPTLILQPQSSTVCKNEASPILSVASKDGVGTPQYQWFSNEIDDRTTGAPITGETISSYSPLVSTAGIKYYYCVITFPTGGCGSLTSDIAKVTVNQYPVISDFTRLIGSGTNFTVDPALLVSKDTVPVGTTYTWSMPVVSPANAISGAAAEFNQQSIIRQLLINNTKQVATVTYTVHPVSKGCTGADFKIEVTVNPSISSNALVTDIDCYAADNGKIMTDIAGGIPPYNILWTGPIGYISTNPSIYNLAPGEYQLKISDNGGLPFAETYTIHEPTDVVLSTQIKKNVSCFGDANGQISISVSGGTPPYHYLWKKNNIPFDTIQNISNLQPGEYVVVVTDKNNCGHKTETYTITEPSEIIVSVVNQKNLLCFGDTNGSVELSITGGIPIESSPGVYEYTYKWSGPNNFKSNDKNIAGLIAGQYILVVTDNTGCVKNFSTYITQPDEIKIDATLTPITCYGTNDATIKINLSGGISPYLIEWSNLAKGDYLEDLAPGTYTVKIIDANACVMTKSFIIEESQFSIKPEQKNVSCFGANDGTITLNIMGGVPPITLKWSDNSNAGYTRNRLAPGKYTVTLTDAAYCPIVKSFIITEPLPITVVSNVTNAFVCDNPNSGSIHIVVSGGTEPYNFEWSNGQTSEDISNIPGGTYIVTITDKNSCSLTKQFTVLRQEPLNLSVNITPDFDCSTKVLKQICTAQITGGVPPYKFNWSSGTVKGVNSEIMESNQSGLVDLSVTDGLGCSTNYSFNLTVPSVGIHYEILNCNNRLFGFRAVIPSGLSSDYSYLWDFGDGNTDTTQNPEHTFLKPDVYRITLTLKSSTCTSVFENDLNVSSLPVLFLDKLPIFCKGDSIMLHVGGADSYRWFNGSTADSIRIKDIGDCSVTGTTKLGCTSTLNFKVKNFELNNYSIQSDRNEVYKDNSEVRLWSESITYSDYFWDFGDEKSAQGNNQEHRYDIQGSGYYDVKLMVKNPNGCLEYATKRIWITSKTLDNTFTPNGDGIDDVFMKYWHIKVYNRNGILIYDGTDGWDGSYKGQPVSNDTYFFVVYYQSDANIKTNSGFVTVVR